MMNQLHYQELFFIGVMVVVAILALCGIARGLAKFYHCHIEQQHHKNLSPIRANQRNRH